MGHKNGTQNTKLLMLLEYSVLIRTNDIERTKVNETNTKAMEPKLRLQKMQSIQMPIHD